MNSNRFTKIYSRKKSSIILNLIFIYDIFTISFTSTSISTIAVRLVTVIVTEIDALKVKI